MEIAGDRSRSIGERTFVTAIFSFRTVKERRRLVEMVKQNWLSRFEGGTGGVSVFVGTIAQLALPWRPQIRDLVRMGVTLPCHFGRANVG